MKHRIVLTRGEVDKIIRQHLDGEKGVSPTKPKRWLSVLNDDELRLVKPTDPGTPWEAWPAYAMEWEEEV